MIKNSISSAFIVLLLVGCAINPSTAMVPIASDTPTVGDTIPSTTTRLPESTITVIPDPKFIQRCLEVKDKEIALKEVTFGTILLNTYLPKDRFLLVDIKTGEEYELPAIGDGQVSPDGNMFAYIEQIRDTQLDSIINEILWVVDARGSLLARISFDQGYLGPPRWLDNERLIFYTDQTEQNGTVMVVNPFTREQRMVSNELPMLYTYPFPGGPSWRVEYSPDLEWVAYFYIGDNKDGLGPRGPIVRDIIRQQTLWQSTSGDEGKPAWSPDGREVAVIGDGKLYLVNRSGEVKLVLNEALSNDTQSPSWSPDGNLIAFWNAGSLMIYDRQAEQTFNLCLQSNGALPPATPLWSPDSRQIVVHSSIGEALVDLPKNVIYKMLEIKDTQYPVVWMNSLP